MIHECMLALTSTNLFIRMRWEGLSEPPSAEAGDGQEIEEEVPELAMKDEDE